MYLIKTFMAMVLLCLVAFVQAEVNINTATEQQLMELNNIGAVKAAAIVGYRSKHGHFQNVDDLLKVDGIGMAILEENRHMLIVEAKPPRSLATDEVLPMGQDAATRGHSPSMDKVQSGRQE